MRDVVVLTVYPVSPEIDLQSEFGMMPFALTVKTA
jgi:hypothetical protein